jgi:hypothetical protein
MGLSKDVDLLARIFVSATGNNATLGSDLIRRFLTCRIDTKLEQPGLVSHSFDPATVAKETRIEIAQAVLTIQQAYWQAGPVTISGGSDFPEWSKLVREPIVWIWQCGLAVAAGIGVVTDPVAALGVATESPDQIGLSQLLGGIELEVGLNKPFSSRSLHAWYVEGGEMLAKESKAMIREGLDTMIFGKVPTPSMIGQALHFRKDRIADGLRLAHLAKDRLGVLWQVSRD